MRNVLSLAPCDLKQGETLNGALHEYRLLRTVVCYQERGGWLTWSSPADISTVVVVAILKTGKQVVCVSRRVRLLSAWYLDGAQAVEFGSQSANEQYRIDEGCGETTNRRNEAMIGPSSSSATRPF